MDLNEKIKFIDFHTHQVSGDSDTVSVVNIFAGESVPDSFPPNTLFSAGIHPWHLTSENAEEMKTGLVLSLAHPHVVMIGEAGFDTLKGPDEKLQYDVFCYQAELAEEMKMPMIIHCVKGWDLLLKAKTELKPSVKWIIHGFRGKEELAQLLAGETFLFSLGEMGISKGIIDVVGFDRILAETDASGNEIRNVYGKIAEVTGESPDKLSVIIRRNFNSCFSNTDTE
jgi:TatD DNase family protein